MHKFEFHSAPRILFGRGQAERLGEVSAQFGSSALVVHSGGGPGEGGVVDRVAGALSVASVKVTCVRQRGEPQVRDVDRALDSARAADCHVVIALGGGSAIDTAKAVAGLLANGGGALD